MPTDMESLSAGPVRASAEGDVWGWLARELHDGVTQQVWYLQTELSYLSERAKQGESSLHSDLDRLLKVAQDAYTELRSTLGMLSARSVSLMDLGRELAELVERFSRSVGMEVTFHRTPKECRVEVLSPAGRQITRLVQEALWNSWRHSMSNRAKVTLRQSKTGVVVTVSDDGCGFDPGKVDRSHYGLRNMRERAEAINGKLYVTSRAGKGTIVALHVSSVELGSGMKEVTNNDRTTASG